VVGDLYWGWRVLHDLEAMLTAVRTLDAELGARRKDAYFNGILEQKRYADVDGRGAQARLTLIGLPCTRWAGEPSRVRVDVLTTGNSYGMEHHDLPRYVPSDDPRATEQPEPPDHPDGSTRAVAEYLFQRSGGEPDSLRHETGGAWSFTVVISRTRTAVGNWSWHDWYWGELVLYEFKAMLAAVRTLDTELRARRQDDNFNGILEKKLYAGMDGGAAQARLTMIGLPPTRWRGEPSRVRVDVLTTGHSYAPGQEHHELPHYVPSDDPRATEQPEPPGAQQTRAVAEYLFQRSGGEPDSLRQETGGAWSFTVVISQ
jgi:hypothetical protein